MEDVSTGVFEKIKNIEEVKKKPKIIWSIKTYIIAFVNIQKNEDILSIMSNLQSNRNMAYMASDRLAAN